MAAPTITSAASASFQVGSAGTFTVTTTGFIAGQPGITAAGQGDGSGTGQYTPPFLPPGVTFKDNTGGTATLAGTPSGGDGVYAFTITAANGTLPNATQAFTLTVLADIVPPAQFPITCPRCKAARPMVNVDGGINFFCAGCEWRWVMSTQAPTGALNAGVAVGAVALPVASGGASFTTGMVLLVDTGTSAEVVTVPSPGGTGTSIPVPPLAKAHLSAATFGQLLLTPAFTAVDRVPAAPGWGF